MTIHKAQGLTCDTALVYATDDQYRELGYVALSRGRDLNVIYTTGDVKIDPEAHIRTPQRVPSEMLMAGLSTSRAQELTIDVAERGADVTIERLSTPDLVAERQRLQAVLDAAPAVPSADYAHEVEYTERNLANTERDTSSPSFRYVRSMTEGSGRNEMAAAPIEAAKSNASQAQFLSASIRTAERPRATVRRTACLLNQHNFQDVQVILSVTNSRKIRHGRWGWCLECRVRRGVVR